MSKDGERHIMMLAAPTDNQELQNLLGTINVMSTFIPNLTKKTHLMRGLLKLDVQFIWTSDAERIRRHQGRYRQCRKAQSLRPKQTSYR